MSVMASWLRRREVSRTERARPEETNVRDEVDQLRRDLEDTKVQASFDVERLRTELEEMTAKHAKAIELLSHNAGVASRELEDMKRGFTNLVNLRDAQIATGAKALEEARGLLSRAHKAVLCVNGSLNSCHCTRGVEPVLRAFLSRTAPPEGK